MVYLGQGDGGPGLLSKMDYAYKKEGSSSCKHFVQKEYYRSEKNTINLGIIALNAYRHKRLVIKTDTIF